MTASPAPLSLRLPEVVRVEAPTPGTRRVVLGGPELAGFTVPSEALGPYVKLLIPPPEGEPAWPAVCAGGRLLWPETGPRPAMRTYSVRRHDAAAGELTLDVVLHGEGAGSGWARRARPGDRVGLWGPGAPMPPQADWVLLAGDHTALPAMAFILENLPAGTCGQAFIEVPGPAEEQPLPCPAAVSLTWLHRDACAGPSALAACVCAARCPSGARPLVWAGAEAGIARAIRRHARRELGLEAERVQVLNHWKRGAPEGAFDYST